MFKPRLTANFFTQFKIPPPYHVWCHICNVGFMSIAEEREHWRKEHERKQK
jgi:hypothetical protein